MSTLTPTGRAILTHLRDQPADAATLRDTTRRSLITIEKTLTDLTHRDLITQHGGDEGNDYWTLTDTGRASIDSLTGDETGTDMTGTDTTDTQEAGTDTDSDDGGPHAVDNDTDEADDTGRIADDGEPVSIYGGGNAGDQPSHADGPVHGLEAGPEEDGSASPARGDSDHQGDHQPNQESDQESDQEVDSAPALPRHCRGCRKELPAMCPTCWQKTPLYCGECRRSLPVGRRGAPSEPEILSNGLRKLMPGELEKLVLEVFRTHPVPDFAGVVGWNSGRIAIHLPGRSHGAINRVLDKLTGTGQVVLINTSPKYYRPALDTPTTPGSQPGTEDPTATGSQPDTTPDHPADHVADDGGDDGADQEATDPAEPDTGDRQDEPAHGEHDNQRSDDQHSDDQHSDDQHSDDQHSDDQHSDDQHSDDQHSDDQHSE